MQSIHITPNHTTEDNDMTATVVVDGQHVTQDTKPNIMGGTNVITRAAGVTCHVASYATASNAHRAIRTGAALRVARQIEASSPGLAYDGRLPRTLDESDRANHDLYSL